MNILIIGSGAREHALTWKINQSEKIDQIYIAPGNAGTSLIGKNVDIKADDINGLLSFALENAIDLTIVGPEVPLVLGIADLFRKNNLKIVGPSQKASLLEGSKATAKEFMERYNIPTAKYKEYTSVERAKNDLGLYGYPMVIKADGLAAGKGVLIPETKKEAEDALNTLMVDKKFGDAGEKIIIEEFLEGIEASVLCFVDGKTILPMETAQDYKRAKDGDQGLNTGGMGAYSPSVVFNDSLKAKVNEKVLVPFIEGIKTEELDFRGILFVGLMIKNDDIKVLEFNVRFGDPETQVILPRLETDLVEVFLKLTEKKLDQVKLKWSNQKSVGVVMASGGYPTEYIKGYPIYGLNGKEMIFHAGTKKEDNQVITNGGRVLSAVCLEDTLEKAHKNAYKKVREIKFQDCYYRTDIGLIK